MLVAELVVPLAPPVTVRVVVRVVVVTTSVGASLTITVFPFPKTSIETGASPAPMWVLYTTGTISIVSVIVGAGQTPLGPMSTVTCACAELQMLATASSSAAGRIMIR